MCISWTVQSGAKVNPSNWSGPGKAFLALCDTWVLPSWYLQYHSLATLSGGATVQSRVPTNPLLLRQNKRQAVGPNNRAPSFNLLAHHSEENKRHRNTQKCLANQKLATGSQTRADLCLNTNIGWTAFRCMFHSHSVARKKSMQTRPCLECVEYKKNTAQLLATQNVTKESLDQNTSATF